GAERAGGVGEARVEDLRVLREDWVERDVLRDALERDVRDGPVLEATGGVGAPVGGVVILDGVVRERRGHEPLTGERERDAGRVDRDPAPAPLLRDERGRAAPARRVEDEVAGIGGHEEAALDDERVRLDDIKLVHRGAGDGVTPDVVERIYGVIAREPYVVHGAAALDQACCTREAGRSSAVRGPAAPSGRHVSLSAEFQRIDAGGGPSGSQEDLVAKAPRRLANGEGAFAGREPLNSAIRGHAPDVIWILGK